MATPLPGDGQPCRLLDCPREIRDQIYAEILLDFPRPSLECLLNRAELEIETAKIETYEDLLDFDEYACNIPPSFPQYAAGPLHKTHKIDTSILLANRQTFAEAKQIILRRGRLVTIRSDNVDFSRLLYSSQLCLIDGKYSSLSILTHYMDHDCIGRMIHPRQLNLVLCCRDVDNFCRAIMGDTAFILRYQLCPTIRHTLAFTTNFHQKGVVPEYQTRDNFHRQVLQPFRKRLRGFPSVSLHGHGSCVKMSRVLAVTAVKEMKSEFILYPDEILSEMKSLMLQSNEWLKKGRYPYTALPLYKAMGLCQRILRDSELWARVKSKASDPEAFVNDILSEAYRLMVMLLTTWLEFAPQLSPDAPYTFLTVQTYEMCLAAARSFGAPDWSPPKHMEMCMHSCVARGLYAHRAQGVTGIPLAIGYKAAQGALKLAPRTEKLEEKLKEKLKKFEESYEDWKETAVRSGDFVKVSDDLLVEHGIAWWSGSEPWSYM